jgi:hypothetical protein
VKLLKCAALNSFKNANTSKKTHKCPWKQRTKCLVSAVSQGDQ